MTDDFYGSWDDPANKMEDYYGPKPRTVEEKIAYGVATYSGDSGVSDEELEAYLNDLVLTAAREATAPAW